MKRIRVLLPVAGALALVDVAPRPALAGSPVEQQQQPPPQDDGGRARDLFKKGKRDYDEGRIGDAYRAYREAWGLQKSFDIAGNLSRVELELALYRDAAEHVAFALASFPAGGTDAQRAALKSMLAQAKKEVGSITVRVTVEHASITLDGRPAGESPLSGELYVEPGDHAIIVTAPGCDPVRENVHTDHGTAHLVTLTPQPRSTHMEGGAGGATTVPSSGPSVPIVVAGFATSGVGVGLGAAFAIVSKIKASNADGIAARLNPNNTNRNACAQPTPANSADCNTLHSDRVSRDALANAALWTFVGAGAVAAGTLIYTLAVKHGSPAPKAAGFEIVPSVAPNGGALLIRGVF